MGNSPEQDAYEDGFDDGRKVGYRRGLEDAAKVADTQAWAHGGKHFNGPELNSAKIAEAIRAMMDKQDSNA